MIVADLDSATSTSSMFKSAHFSGIRQIQLLELSFVLLSLEGTEHMDTLACDTEHQFRGHPEIICPYEPLCSP
jgi:hypothetical protein